MKFFRMSVFSIHKSYSNYPSYFSKSRYSQVDFTRMESTLTTVKSNLRSIFEESIRAVLPHFLVKNQVQIVENELLVGKSNFFLKDNVYVVGFGKAVIGMAIVLEEILGNRLKKGIISIPKGSNEMLQKIKNSLDSQESTRLIQYREGAANNQPDNDSLETTRDILNMVQELTEDDSLIVLISGGGSALLFMPKPIITSEMKQQFCKNLQNAGADIIELNKVRQKLSIVKGGGLAKFAYPASVLSLIISDIIGDPINLIASGPTVYCSESQEAIKKILKKYNLDEDLDKNLKKLLTFKEQEEVKGLLNEKKEFKHVKNIIVGNNNFAMEAARIESIRKGLSPIIIRNDVKGEVHNVSLAYARLVFYICLAAERVIGRRELLEKMENDPLLPIDAKKVDEIFNVIERNADRGIVLIGGGEPTVTVRGSGKGGRNQELALYFSMDWLAKIKLHPQLAKYDVVILSGGTDGQDGPTDAAGAFGYPAIAPLIYSLRDRVRKVKIQKEISSDFLNVNNNIPENLDFIESEIEKMIPEFVLNENDTYNFFSRFKKGEDLIKTGLTGTNVMDLHFVLIKKRQCKCSIEFKNENEYNLPNYSDENMNNSKNEYLLKELELHDIKVINKSSGFKARS